MQIKLNQNYQLAMPALFLMLLGMLVSIGWILEIQSLVRVFPTLKPMVLSTALCFVLVSINLLSDFYLQGNLKKVLTVVSTIIVLIMSSLVLMSYFFGTPAYVDFPDFHKGLVKDDLQPGLMGANTAICFFIASLALVIAIKQLLSLVFSRAVKLAAVCIFLIGFLGFIGYVFNLRELYSWVGAARMALHTGFGMMLLGIGLYIKANNQQERLDEAKQDEETISSVVFFTLFLTGISTAVVAFGFLQGRTIEVLKEDYSQQVSERALFFDEIIEHRSKRATTLLGNNKLINIAKSMVLNQAPSLDDIAHISRVAEENEFSAIYLILENGGKKPIFVNKMAQTDFLIDLDGQSTRHLLWDEGFVLQSLFSLELTNSEAKIAFEQPLTILTRFTGKWLSKGKSNNQQVCGADKKSIICFPDRYHKKPFIIKQQYKQLQPPVAMAVNGQFGIVRFFNDVGYQTIATYHAVGETGLGMALMIEVREIYAPIIKSFFYTILFTALVLGFGFFMIQSKAKPLVEKISTARRIAEKDRNRFIAATEGGLDNFYIFEAVRDGEGQIVDFKFVYLNNSASKLINKAPDEMVGKMLFEELPFTKQKKYFSRFKYVIETGQTIAEEIKVDEEDVNATWIYWQVVKLDDGFSITSRDVTDQHRIMESLAASRERIQQILANQNVATFIIDADHRVTHWNLACEKLTGVEAKRMVGSKDSWRGFYQEARPCLADLVLEGHIDSAGAYYETEGQSTLLKSGWHAEAWFEQLGGRRRYVIFDAAPIVDNNGKIVAAIETLQDVTETKLAEQALAIEKQHLDSVIEGTNAGTWQWNVSSGELRFNEQWAEMLGYAQSKIGDGVVQTWHALIHPDELDAVEQQKQRHILGETELFEAEFRMRHRRGHWVWIASRGRIMTKTASGEPEWMYGTHMDISARKQADIELKQAYANLEEFTAIASHDLKSPLRGIGDLMEWIEEDLGSDIPDNVKSNLQRVQLRVKRMGSLINDLLAYSRAGVVSDDEQLLNVDEMLKEVVELQHISKAYKVKINCKIKPFKTNETPLKTILRNLISNALKHHDKDTGNIEIEVRAKGEYYIFEVKDDGPGIPENVKERVFKLFQTLAKSTDSSGVGLAVSKRMAEAHGGHLELESNIEKRVTIFRLFWPKTAHRKLQTYE